MWLARQTKDSDSWLLVAAHPNDGGVLLGEVEASEPHIKPLHLSAGKIVSKAFLHLLMTGRGRKRRMAPSSAPANRGFH